MAYVKRVVDTYNYIFTDLADPRTNGFFLMSSPVPIVTLTALYLYFCTSFGPKYMKDRQPYNLKNVVLFYNIFQVFMSSYLFYLGSQYMLSKEYSFTCAPVDYSNNPMALHVAVAGWWYFFTKVIEFLDTIFFVLRKKNNQISFLHVYHHSLMAFFMWIGVKYFAGGHGALMPTLNSFVHIVMYTYYLIAGLGPQYQKYVWWKKHVTVLQLVQFVIIVVHSVIPLFNDCPYPKILNILMAINAALFINLFGKFFHASYIKGSHSSNKKGIVNGTTTNGTASNGTASNGTASNDTAKNGTATNGTASNGTTKNGPAKNGTATNGTSNGHSHIMDTTDQFKNGVKNIKLKEN